jgi:biopolymer transport protein ExbB
MTGLLQTMFVSVAAVPDSGPLERSFAGAFFISRNADQSVELLGSVIIWLLLILSIASIGMIMMMAMTNTRETVLPATLVESVRRQLAAGKFKEAMAATADDDSFFARIMHGGMQQASHGYGAIIRGLEQTADEQTTVRFRRIELLNVLGQVSPMIGLFGTVYGMILAFQAIVVSGGNADPVLLAGGIGTALTTTFWGLVVAIPALAGYAIIRNRIDEMTTEATLQAESILGQFRPKRATKSTAKSTDAGGDVPLS